MHMANHISFNLVQFLPFPVYAAVVVAQVCRAALPLLVGLPSEVPAGVVGEEL
jgi:hypothetical protein